MISAWLTINNALLTNEQQITREEALLTCFHWACTQCTLRLLDSKQNKNNYNWIIRAKRLRERTSVKKICQDQIWIRLENRKTFPISFSFFPLFFERILCFLSQSGYINKYNKSVCTIINISEAPAFRHRLFIQCARRHGSWPNRSGLLLFTKQRERESWSKRDEE